MCLLVLRLSLSGLPWEQNPQKQLRKLNFLSCSFFPGHLGYLTIQPMCVVGMRWQWGYCFTRCTNTLVQHACIRSVSSWHRIVILTNGMKSPAASQQTVPHLGTGKAICLGGKREKCLFGLVGLTVSPVKVMLQLSAFEQMGTNLHLINPTSPPRSSWRILLFFFPSPRCFMPLYCLKPSSLKDGTFLEVQNQSSCFHWMTDRHVFSLFSGLECLIKKAWLGPLMSIWIKSAQWLPGHSPHSNWKPNVHPPHIN